MKKFIFIILAICFSFVITPTVYARNAMLTWDLPIELDLDAIFIFCGESTWSGVVLAEGLEIGFVDPDITEFLYVDDGSGLDKYCVVQANNIDDQRSNPSNEIIFNMTDETILGGHKPLPISGFRVIWQD